MSTLAEGEWYALRKDSYEIAQQHGVIAYAVFTRLVRHRDDTDIAYPIRKRGVSPFLRQDAQNGRSFVSPLAVLLQTLCLKKGVSNPYPDPLLKGSVSNRFIL